MNNLYEIINQQDNNTIDLLTGLPNRKGLIKVSSVLDKLLQEQKYNVDVLSVKLARFKHVNDGFGDDLGDKVIQLFTKRFQKLFPDVYLLGRMAGSNFCFIFVDSEDIEKNIKKLIEFSERPMLVGGENFVLNIVIGTSTSDYQNLTTMTDCIHAAEVAQHTALKTKYKVVHYEQNMKDEASENISLENDLRVSLTKNALKLHQALNNNEFFLVYQPIMDSRTNTIAAFESLIRWQHPKRGIVSPGEFIPMAEQINIMTVLGNWILKRACKALLEFDQYMPFGQSPSISINISPSQLIDGEILVKTLKDILEETKIDPKRIKLEITESEELPLYIEQHLETIKELGCELSMDDFGTGYSSINQLQNLPFDNVKIDQSFVQKIDSEDEKEQKTSIDLIKAIIALTDIFELKTIVEGVETKEQLEKVNELGVHLIQGYYFSKPLKEEEMPEFINKLNNIQQ